MSNYILSLDKGSTNIKAVLFDLEGNEIMTALRRYGPFHQPHPGWNEQDMNRVWKLTKEAIQEILDGGIDAGEIASIGLSGQGNGLLMLDEHGKPARNVIMSVDSRAQDITDRWREEGTVAQVREICGLNMYSAIPCPLLRWLKENEGDIYRNFRWVIFSKDWIKYNLTGRICTDPTDAGSLLDIKTGEYSEEIFDLCGISECREKLPEIVPSMDVSGTVTRSASKETGLKEGTPVISGIHDIASCSYGAGGVEQGHVTIVLGTLGFNLLVLDGCMDKEIGEGITFHALPQRRMALGCELSSGSSLDWFINVYCQEESNQAGNGGKSVYEILENKMSDTASGLIYHPFINGKIEQSAACAGIYGLKAWHKKEHVIRSVYEGIAFAHCQLIENDFKEFIDVGSVSLAGGGARSGIWGQMFADILKIPVTRLGIDEITCRGAALGAGVGAGIYEDPMVAKTLSAPSSRQYAPHDQDSERYLRYFETFKRINNGMKEIWDEMEGHND